MASNQELRQASRILALHQAAVFVASIPREDRIGAPDAQEVIDMARVFEAFLNEPAEDGEPKAELSQAPIG